MSTDTTKDAVLSRDAYDAFSRVAGEIRKRALQIAEEKALAANRRVVSVEDVKAAFYEAAQETAVSNRG